MQNTLNGIALPEVSDLAALAVFGSTDTETLRKARQNALNLAIANANKAAAEAGVTYMRLVTDGVVML